MLCPCYTARAPAHVPTGALIFKSISAKGFWLTKWMKERQERDKNTAVQEASDNEVRDFGSFLPACPRLLFMDTSVGRCKLNALQPVSNSYGSSA